MPMQKTSIGRHRKQIVLGSELPIALEGDDELQKALKDLLTLAGMSSSAALTTQAVQKAIEKLTAQLASPGAPSIGALALAHAPPHGEADSVPIGRHKNILLVGQLGMILHQIKHLLTPLCAEISLARSLETAVVAYQQEQPTLVIIDLLMPTPREGVALLQAIRQLARQATLPAEPEIIILGSSTKDIELTKTLQTQGANHILDRQDGWQQAVLKIYRGEG